MNYSHHLNTLSVVFITFNLYILEQKNFFGGVCIFFKGQSHFQY